MKLTLKFTLAMLLLASCNKEMLQMNEKLIAVPDESSVIVKKLDNPYSLKNMNKAYINLLRNKGLPVEVPANIPPCLNCGGYPILLEPTHTYVKILPRDTAHYDELLKDTNIVMFDYPLDVDVSEGENVVESEIGPNGFKYLYTKLSVNSAPPLAFSTLETLDSLYIPIEADAPINADIPMDESGNIVTKSGVKINFYEILDESMRITGHLDKEIKTKGLFGSKWNPSATISAWDHEMERFTPLRNTKVRARHLFHWDTRYTDDNGYAKFETFRYAVNYSIAWEHHHWDIRDGNIWQAYYNGPKQKSQWNLNIRGAKSGHYAMIHRACVRYFYDDIGGLKKPYNSLSNNLKIAYLDKNNNRANGYFAPWTTAFSFLKNITLYSTVNNQRRNEFDIFSTAIHEITHYAHCVQMGNIQFMQVSNNVGESWARAVQWHLAGIEYASLGHTPSEDMINSLNVQDWSSATINKAYSPLFIDLIDNFNQSTVDRDRPNDNVTGYTMSQLNTILMKGYGLSSLKSELKKNKPNGVTDQEIDQLFLRYEQLM